MQFDAFIQSLLESLEELKLPVFDGKREVYQFSGDCSMVRLQDEIDTAIVDYDPEVLQVDYDIQLFYSGDSFKEALDEFVREASRVHYGVQKHVNEIREQVGHLKGHWVTWKQHNRVYIAVDVDIVQMRLLDIQHKLKHADTSGLEDLL
jgi:hypothetical protein